MKSQVLSQQSFESNNECAKEVIHADDGSESSPTVFLSLKGTDEEGVKNYETLYFDHGNPGANKINQANEEVLHPEYLHQL